MRHTNLEKLYKQEQQTTSPAGSVARLLPNSQKKLTTLSVGSVRRYGFICLVLLLVGVSLISWWLLTPSSVGSPGNRGASIVPELGVVYITSKVELNNLSVKNGGVGLVITEVKPVSPASRAGLQPGDLITHLGGHSLSADESLLSLLSSYRSGDLVLLEVRRANQPLQFTIKLT